MPGLRGHVLRLLGDAARGAAVVEGPHRELGARLADRLRGDDAHRLADLDRFAGGQVAAVALRAHAAPRLAGEHRTDLDPLDARAPGSRLATVSVISWPTLQITSPVIGS